MCWNFNGCGDFCGGINWVVGSGLEVVERVGIVR